MGVIAKQSIRATVITYVGVAVGFVTTFFVLTRFLTSEEIGLARVLVDAATLFIGLAQLGTTSSTIRFYPYFRSEDGREHGFFFWTLIVPFIGFGIFALLYIALAGVLQNYFGERSALFVNYYYFVLPIAFFMLYQTVFETDSNVRMRIVVPRAVRELLTRIGLLILYLLYAFRWLSLDGFVWGLCAVYALAALCNILYFVLTETDLGIFRPDISYLKNNLPIVRRYASYTAFLILSAVATILAPYISSFIITAEQGLSETGIFAIATYMAVIVSIPYRSLNAIAAPQLAAAIKEDDTKQINSLTSQVANNLLLVGSLILLTIWINIDLIYHILPNGQIYETAKYCVLILGLSQLLLATFNISLTTLNYSKFYYLSLIWSAVLTVSAIWLNNKLIPQYGMNGAAMANLLSYALYFVLILLTTGLMLHTTPLTKNMLKTLFIATMVLALNYIWKTYAPSINMWLDSIIRSVILLGGTAIITWQWHISPEIEQWVKDKIFSIKKG